MSEARSEEEGPRPFYVSISTVKGNTTFNLEMQPNDTFAHLKHCIQDESGILYEDQNLFSFEADSKRCVLKPVDRDTVKVCLNNFDFSCQSNLTLELHLVVATERASDALFAFTQVPPNLRRSLCLMEPNWPPELFGDCGDGVYVRQIGGEHGPLYRLVHSRCGRNWQTRISRCDVCHTINGDVVESDKKAIVLKHCGGCHYRDYCSKECQREDWYIMGHRLECKFTKVEVAWKETIQENAELQEIHFKVASEFCAEELEEKLSELMEFDYPYPLPINYALVVRLLHENRNDCGVISSILQKSIFEEYITDLDIKRANLTDVMPCILSVMRINLEDVAMQIVCTEALRSMISLDRFSESILLKAGGVREIVFAMDKHSSKLQHVCLNVLVLVTSGSKRYLSYCAEIKEVYYPRGATAVGITAVGLAAKVLNKYSKSKTDCTSNILAHLVLVAIRHLIDFGSSDFWLTCKRAQDANVQQATLVLLDKRQGSAEIQRHGLGLLRELATNPSTIPFKHEELTCIRAIVRAMDRHRLDMGIAERGLQFFQHVVQSSPTGLFCTSKPEVLSVILQSLRKFPDSSSLAQLAMPTLGEILFDHIGNGETMRIARTVDTAVVINRAKSFIITDFRGFSPRPDRAGSWVALCDCLLTRLSGTQSEGG
mmetsp:Transcript_20293/g.32885  ORF Transcript_20293/g.32885 Transcript_20293/m.32885 type:complete len:658 (-) Transcript_20293:86-2059(-)|eukprot:CAMPEP_0198683982 /NCGR_PEP_ID=MMETSP1468-20131203/11511_1 /TAXON_ID=1461545 /ORGANISM="Mantoniella sp, Strain CCMP1436" /LENGTH=657 /DNA_ID=CAMNT_0044428465 /DNA_START=207 /DNA_END=2180 /DNA_ORIENTATION=-